MNSIMPSTRSKSTAIRINSKGVASKSKRKKTTPGTDPSQDSPRESRGFVENRAAPGPHVLYSLLWRLADFYLRPRSDAESRFSKEEAETKQQHRKEKSLIRIFLLAAVILCGVWVIVFLSGSFSAEEKKWMTGLFEKLIFALLGILAGRGMKS
jgi:hypothetical protein